MWLNKLNDGDLGPARLGKCKSHNEKYEWGKKNKIHA